MRSLESKGVTSRLSIFPVVSRTVRWTILCFFIVMTIFPPLWLILSSLKTNLEFQVDPFGWPEKIQWGNYQNALQLTGLFRFMLNSMFVSLMSTALNLVVSCMASYALARFDFRLKKVIVRAFSVCILIPIIALVIPYLRIVRMIGLYDTLFGLIIVYASVNLPISVYLLHSYMGSIPFEIEEAAVIDGCSLWRRFTKIVMPLSRPGIATVGMLVFLYSWNEFIYALLLTSSEKTRTIQLGIRFFNSQFFIDYTSMFAAITITIIPTILIYVLFHDQIISGVTAGATKQ